MLRKLVPLALASAGMLWAAPALACADMGCTTSWTLDQPQYDGCNNLPFLSPGNDSRTNLQLMMIDAGLAKIQVPPATPTDVSAAPVAVAGISAAPFTLDDFSGLFSLSQSPAGPPPDDASTSDLADGEGSRCLSNVDGASAFEDAVTAARGLPDAEKAALIAERKGWKPGCADNGGPKTTVNLDGVKSGVGKQYAAYLVGAAAFYDGDYGAAAASFASLSKSNQPWLKEAARYMAGRVEINRAQVGAFGEYGELAPDKVDQKAVAAAEAGFNAYLRDYPNGTYAASARGLLRRVDWLGGRPGKLAADYGWQFAHPDAAVRNVTPVRLSQEIDSKLLTGADPAKIADPTVLAAVDLMQMRPTGETSQGDKTPPALTQAALAAQRPAFAGREALFTYLQAAHAYYVEHDAAGALRLLPAGTPRQPMTALAFSQQALRGLALEASGDAVGARQHWLALMAVSQPTLQRPVLDIALAMNYERAGMLPQVFATGSPIRDAQVREILLNNDAGPDLLRQRATANDGAAHERRQALYVLLYKEVTRGRYKGFLADQALTPADVKPPAVDTVNAATPDPDLAVFQWAGANAADDYVCASLRETARVLARDPADAHALLCLAEFVRASNLDGYALDIRPPKAELGGAPSLFPGSAFSRLELYKQVITNPKAAAGERAYALYRAVNCYAPSGANQCGGTDVPTSQRKAWFKTLKTDYPKSPWADALKYYW
jgi:hypothetical protein